MLLISSLHVILSLDRLPVSLYLCVNSILDGVHRIGGTVSRSEVFFLSLDRLWCATPPHKIVVPVSLCVCTNETMMRLPHFGIH